MAATIQAFVQRALGDHPVSGVDMVQWRQQCMNLNVGTAALDAHRALTTCRQAVIDADGGGDAVLEAQTDQARRGEDDGVVLAGIQLRQAGVDVAAQKADLQVWAARQ